MKIVVIHPIFLENAYVLADRLEIEVGTNISEVADSERGETLLIFGGHEDPSLLLHYQKILNLKYIIFQTENLESSIFCPETKYIDLLKNSTVLDWSFVNMEALKNRYDIDANGIFMFEFLQNLDVKNCKDIDLFFCGASNENRLDTLQEIKKACPNLKCYFDLGYNLADHRKISEILSRTRYVLNIHYYGEAALEAHRINKALSAGCQVISVNSLDKKLDNIYSNFVHFGDVVQLSRNIDHLPEKNGYGELCEKMKPLLYEF